MVDYRVLAFIEIRVINYGRNECVCERNVSSGSLQRALSLHPTLPSTSIFARKCRHVTNVRSDRHRSPISSPANPIHRVLVACPRARAPSCVSQQRAEPEDCSALS